MVLTGRPVSESFTESDPTSGESGLKTQTRIVGGSGYERRLLKGAEHLGWDGKTWNKVRGTDLDATNVAVSLDAAFDVRWGDGSTITGSLDLVKGGQLVGVTASELDSTPTKAVPFEVSLNDDGRLARYRLTLPAFGSKPAMTMDMTYSDFGLGVQVPVPPAAETIHD